MTSLRSEKTYLLDLVVSEGALASVQGFRRINICNAGSNVLVVNKHPITISLFRGAMMSSNGDQVEFKVWKYKMD